MGKDGRNLESWYLDSLENAPFGTLIHDSEGNVLYLNPYLEKLTGYPHAEIPDLHAWMNKVYPDDSYREMVLAERSLPAATEQKQVREAVITARDGRRRLCRFSSVRAASGIRTVIIQEITSRRETDPGPLEDKEYLKLQFYSLPDPLLIWKNQNGDFVLTTFNRAAEAACGVDIAIHVGKPIGQVLQNPEPVAEAMRKCLAEKTTVDCDEPALLLGTTIEYPIDCTFIYLPPGFVVMHTSSNRSELNRTRESLRESDRRYQELVDMMPVTIFEVDTAGNYLLLNREGLKLLGCSRQDLKGLNSVELLVEEDRARARLNFSRVLAGEDTGPNEYIARVHGGREIPVTLHSTRIVRGGSVVGLRGYVIDMSERKKAEDALKKAYAEMENKVVERTRELQQKSEELLEVNTALRVLLRHRQAERKELEESIQINAMDRILPYLEKLARSRLSERQRNWLAIAVSHLNELASPSEFNLQKGQEKLTPAEIQVADLVKNGKTSKEIAEILNIAVRTVESHRKNIRRKLGLKNKRANLRSHLSSA